MKELILFYEAKKGLPDLFLREGFAQRNEILKQLFRAYANGQDLFVDGLDNDRGTFNVHKFPFVSPTIVSLG